MFAFLQRHKKKIVIIVILVLAVLAVFTSGKKSKGNILDQAAGFVIAPLQEVAAGTANWFENTFTNRREASQVKEENEMLKEQIVSLQADLDRIAKYELENKKLSALLKIAQKYEQHESFGATIVAKNPGSWYDVFTIDKGSGQGVVPDMVLCTQGGLVGRVLEVSATYSKGRSILDSRSAVPAMSQRTGDLGVVKGDYTLMNDGLCRMEYIDAAAEIVIGDEIVTSHLSDVYPPGIIIGKVTEIKTDSNGLTKYAIVEPAVDLKHLDTLLVMEGGKHPQDPDVQMGTEQQEQTQEDAQ